MAEFWENAFKDKQEMWGLKPAESAVLTKDFFIEHKVKNVLVPGIGYGRNAQVFMDTGMSVTGIEISKTAIELAQKHFGNDLKIYCGSVTSMPFDNKLFDGIFCYGLIYLLSKDERAKLILDCFNQLTEGGVMVFTAITKTPKHLDKVHQSERIDLNCLVELKFSSTTEKPLRKNLEKQGCWK